MYDNTRIKRILTNKKRCLCEDISYNNEISKIIYFFKFMKEEFTFKTECEKPKSLKKIFSILTTAFPEVEHDEVKFIEYINIVLLEDPIRTKSLRSEIKNKQLKFELDKDFPLNDFWDAADRYLKNLGVSNDERINFKK